MKALAPFALLLLLAGCGRDNVAEAPIKDGIRQTRLAGTVTAGGRTSGEVMAVSAKPAAPQPGPAGTPGIPQGSGGNTGGAALGGTAPATTPGQAPVGGAVATSPTQAASAALQPASAAAAPSPTDAQLQAQALAASMDVVAARWRARAAASGVATNAPTPVEGVAGVQASAIPGTPAVPVPIRSEKLGNAPASEDVKQATKPKTQPIVDPKSPEAAGHKP